MENSKIKTTYILLLLVVIGAFFRFYNLNWGAPFYFHPDERNVATAVSQIRFPTQMHPNFFAYGSFPLYTIYFTGLAQNLFNHCAPLIARCLPSDMLSLAITQSPFWQQVNIVTFEQAIIISRFIAALFSTTLIAVIFLVGQRTHTTATGLLAAVFTTFSVGFIQFAHFGTFEMWLTFLGIILFSFSLHLAKRQTARLFLAASIVAGLLVSTKVSSLILLPLPIFAAMLDQTETDKQSKMVTGALTILRLAIGITMLALFAGIIFVVTNPFVFLDFPGFQRSMQYESGVALGTIPVFYTQEFYETIPGVFQMLHVYPFLANPFITIIFVPALVYVIAITIKKRDKSFLLLIMFFFFLFISQAFLFVKWTRYMVPTLPFISLITAIGINDFIAHVMNKKNLRWLPPTITIFLIGSCTLFAVAYLQAVLTQPDSRITASIWARENTIKLQPSMSEVYDLGTLPFNSIIPTISLCNFYELDSTNVICDDMTLSQKFEQSTIIILPSERIWKTRMHNPKRYPLGNAFYRKLFRGAAGFTQTYETPCNVFCTILYLGKPTDHFEQTATVFDRPTVRIFERK